MIEYRIAWQDKRTGFEGHGEWLRLMYPQMIALTVRTLNHMYPDIDHWTEQRPVEVQPTAEEAA